MLLQHVLKPRSAREVPPNKFQTELGAAQLPGNIYKVAGAGARAVEGAPSRDLAKHGDANRDRVALGRVSTY